MADLKLNGKKALVTGGTSGFGRSAAELLAAEGVDVAVNYARNDEKAEKTLEALRGAGVDALAVKADVADHEACADLVKQVHDRFGHIDVFVHSAGIAGMDDSKPEEWDRVIRVHLYGTHFICRAVEPVMVEQKSGSIVILTSIADNTGGANSYSAAMAGKLSYGLGLAKKLARHNVRVNCVAPGTVFTEMLDPFYKDEEARRKATEERIPLWVSREGIPRADEVGKVILFLASDLSSHITGEEIRVNGGQFVAL